MRSLIIASILLLGSIALAEDSDRAKAHYRSGLAAYGLGHYAEAATEYEAAFALLPDPALLYNAAQAHRLAGHSARALALYQSYLAIAGEDTPNRSEVLERIATLREVVRKDAHAEPASTERVTSPQKPAAPAVIAAPAPVVARTAPAPRSGRGLVIAGSVVGVVGLAAFGGAIGTAIGAKNASDAVTAESSHQLMFNPDEQRTGRLDGAASTALFVVGGVAVVTGATLVILGTRAAHRAERAVVSSTVGQRDWARSF